MLCRAHRALPCAALTTWSLVCVLRMMSMRHEALKSRYVASGSKAVDVDPCRSLKVNVLKVDAWSRLTSYRTAHVKTSLTLPDRIHAIGDRNVRVVPGLEVGPLSLPSPSLDVPLFLFAVMEHALGSRRAEDLGFDDLKQRGDKVVSQRRRQRLLPVVSYRKVVVNQRVSPQSEHLGQRSTEMASILCRSHASRFPSER
jgi:hypothetical protein